MKSLDLVRSFLFFLLVPFLAEPCQAGFAETLRILERPETVAVHMPVRAGGEVLLIPMEFGGADRMEKSMFSVLSRAQVVRVDLVYTDLPKGCDLTALNRERLEVLNAVAPGLFNEKGVAWHLVKQTQCGTEQCARKLFHGFSITYRPAPDPALHKAEIAMVESLSRSIPARGTEATPGHGPERATTLTDGATEDMTSWSISLGGEVSIHTRVETVYVSMIPTYGGAAWEENTVTEVFRRNAFNDCTIVSDVTGSMAPYTVQLIAWWKLKCADGKKRQWVFFNDGDMTPDRDKVIGRTGGVYMDEASTFKEVQDLALRAMTNGGGGDAPENDIEALLKAQSVPGQNELVLVADNWAPIKDISLLAKVDRPVHVVLCGVAGLLNVEYLELARATKGSVHTMEKDLTDLAELHEGEELEVAGQWYRLQAGKFVHVVRS